MGQQDEAHRLLSSRPYLAQLYGSVTDYSKRKFNHITPIQYAWWARDRHMWEMILPFLTQEQAAEQLRELQHYGTEYGSHFDTLPTLLAAYEYYSYPFHQLILVGTTALNTINKCLMAFATSQRYWPVHMMQELCRNDRSLYPADEESAPRFLETTLPRDSTIPTNLYPLQDDAGLGFVFAVRRGLQMYSAEVISSTLNYESHHKALNKPDYAALKDLCHIREQEFTCMLNDLLKIENEEETSAWYCAMM